MNYNRPMNSQCSATLLTESSLGVGGGDADLVLRGANAGVRVAEEGDERGAQDVVLVVVLRAVVVGQLDHPVVVGQPVVGLPQAPRVGAGGG